MDALEVLQPGAFTTIQDMGRYGFQKYGVSISGAMDKFALRISNILVGNSEEEAAIEITLIGPKLLALQDLIIAFAGADLSPQINGHSVPNWCSLAIQKGDIISFGKPKNGCRAYIALAGGIDFPLVMGSRSIHTRSQLGGRGRALAKGDIIKIRDTKRGSDDRIINRSLPPDDIPLYTNNCQVRVILGPQSEYFTRAGINTFLNSEYEITSHADRMGYRLKGPKIEHKAGADILTDATPPGSIQVPGDGMPIILLADAQTTGGYTKIAVVISLDQSLLAQAKPGDKIKFVRVTLGETHRLLKEAEEKILKIKKLFN